MSKKNSKRIEEVEEDIVSEGEEYDEDEDYGQEESVSGDEKAERDDLGEVTAWGSKKNAFYDAEEGRDV